MSAFCSAPFASDHSYEKLCCSHSSSPVNHESSLCVPAWYGRTIKAMEREVHRAFSHILQTVLKITQAVQSAIFYLGSIIVDTNALAGLFRRLNKQVFSAIEQLANIPGYFTKLRTISGSAVDYIDTIQLAGDVEYFYSAKFKSDSQSRVASRIAFTVADIGGALLWFQSMSFYSLNKAAETLGQVRVFSFVPKIIESIPVIRNVANLQRLASAVGEIRIFSVFNRISIGFIAGRALTLAFVFSAVDASQRLLNPQNGTEKIQAGLDLSRYLSELALDAMITIGMTNVVGLGAIGTVCIMTALASFLHKVAK